MSNRHTRRAQTATLAPRRPLDLTYDQKAVLADVICGIVDEGAGLASKDVDKMCTYRAAIGLLVVSALTRDSNWVVQAGSMQAPTGVDDLCVGWDVELARTEGKTGLEYHAWIAKPTGAGPASRRGLLVAIFAAGR